MIQNINVSFESNKNKNKKCKKNITEIRHTRLVQFWFKEVTPKSLLFLSLSIASKHSAFPLTWVSASEMLAISKKFVTEEATSEAAIFKLSW